MDKNVILDLGNVVLDWNVERIVESMQLDPAESRLLHQELFAHPDWLELDRGTVSEPEVIESIGRRSQLSPQTAADALVAAKQSLYAFTETLDLMEEIKGRGIGLYCLSNMSRETYDHIRQWTWFGHFDGIVISGQELCIKPERRIFELIIARYDLDAAVTLFVDDSEANVDAAASLGLQVCHFSKSDSSYEQIREFIE